MGTSANAKYMWQTFYVSSTSTHMHKYLVLFKLILSARGERQACKQRFECNVLLPVSGATEQVPIWTPTYILLELIVRRGIRARYTQSLIAQSEVRMTFDFEFPVINTHSFRPNRCHHIRRELAFKFQHKIALFRSGDYARESVKHVFIRFQKYAQIDTEIHTH